MEKVNQLISSALKQGTQDHSTSTQKDFSHSKQVNYFFAWLKMIYPQDYSFNIAPTDRREDMIKAGSAEYLDGYTKERINKGMRFIREQKMSGESKYLKLDVDLCIGAIRDATRSREAHNALPAPAGKRMDKGEALALIASMRDNLDLEPAEPKRIDTTDIETELTRVDRKGEKHEA